MKFMNDYDIEMAERRYADHPILGPAVRTLQNLVTWTNRNSDGWAYWPKPTRAAAKLMELIERDGTARYALDRERADATEGEYKAALRPIRAFRTRQGADFEIVEVGVPEEDLGERPLTMMRAPGFSGGEDEPNVVAKYKAAPDDDQEQQREDGDEQARKLEEIKASNARLGVDQPVLLVYGDPAEGFRFVGPVIPNDPELDRFVDQELRHTTWWYLPLRTLAEAWQGND